MKFGFLWLLLLPIFISENFAGAQEWTRFRGPNGSGVSDATTVPVKWTNDDYNWQIIYLYDEPKLVPAGTRVEVSIWYNNSPEYAEINNLNSKRAIKYGGPTTDEMMNGWIGYTHTNPKDYTAELSRSETVSAPSTD